MRAHIEVWTLSSFAYRGEEEINILYKRHLFMQYILVFFFSHRNFSQWNFRPHNMLRARKIYFVFFCFFSFACGLLMCLHDSIEILFITNTLLNLV
ncbi:hypothetical protein CEF07_04490 [Chlamydia abortus]|nr:hypothetical protein CEF07_04490 [Chlamydia abortus]